MSANPPLQVLKPPKNAAFLNFSLLKRSKQLVMTKLNELSSCPSPWVEVIECDIFVEAVKGKNKPHLIPRLLKEISKNSNIRTLKLGKEFGYCLDQNSHKNASSVVDLSALDSMPALTTIIFDNDDKCEVGFIDQLSELLTRNKTANFQVIFVKPLTEDQKKYLANHHIQRNEAGNLVVTSAKSKQLLSSAKHSTHFGEASSSHSHEKDRTVTFQP